jgi:hypothetical protein
VGNFVLFPNDPTIATEKASQTMNATGVGRGRPSFLLFAALSPEIIVPWQSGEYSLNFANHSSKYWAWKAYKHEWPRSAHLQQSYQAYGTVGMSA